MSNPKDEKNIRNKICPQHHIEYDYVCPECVKPFLKDTKFNNLQEIRDYQKNNSKRIKLVDLKSEYNIIGIIKTKVWKENAYSGLKIYDLRKNKEIDTTFRSYKPIFPNYFPSILFLNHTEIYMDLIKNIDISVDCCIINTSGQIHPYLYGSACDLGLKIKIPVIGYTKNLLFGELGEIKESPNILGVFFQKSLIGYAVSKPNSKKFFYLSVGNNISLQSALRVFLKIDYNLFSTLNNELNNFFRKRYYFE
ncbi:MAG: hypothetical protein EU532_03510 [Promethearchaeota archaeon]|nr:MAG: hypothetical protein EU532_03510 [Candidatus Lokiarchaeota archaeon]